ncbi:MAG: class I SAM-dependent methyltransferase [Gammaproteobacteria bacterium]|nr:class I SAM-dependent methyltransferase [Gammaproteobacteria bacterium]MCP5424011.1 class I SAM-dependent methyltransferase [Gammaproteobacteria bacterium]
MRPLLKLHDPQAYRSCSELDLIRALLPLDGARVLELGCGNAEMTRLIAEQFPVAEIVATEVDEIQHDQNLETPIPKVSFHLAGAQAIPEKDGSCDVVLMFKSLHHVPIPLMDQALAEIRRVLKPGGLAYFSEPVPAGDFNELMRLFNDEQTVREAALAALQRTLDSGALELVEEVFFQFTTHFPDFATFEQRAINVSYADHRLDDALYLAVRQRFLSHCGEQGADFPRLMRVELLRRPSH